MPSPHDESSSGNGVSHRNLFVELDLEGDLRRAPTAAPEPAAVARDRDSRQRGRGLVVPVIDGRLPQDARAFPVVTTFVRSGSSVGELLFAARRCLQRADGNAQRLLGRLVARPHRALSALIAVAALLLTVSWLAVSLRTTAAARDHAQQQQRAATVAFEQAHRRLDTLTAQPARGAGAAGAAHRQQAAAAAAVATWRARAVADRRRPRHARHGHHR
jgi:hypothetical protein